MGLFDEILKRRGYEPVAEVILIPETDGVIEAGGLLRGPSDGQ